MVQKNYTWRSGNEKIDDFIQEMQLNFINYYNYYNNNYDNIVFEWIPYNQFNEIKEIGKNYSITTYSAIWKDGPLYWNKQNEKYARNSNKEVALKCLHNSQNLIKFVINEV